MKTSQKGFIIPVLLGVIAILVIGGGIYVYQNKKVETPASVDTKTEQTPQSQEEVAVQTNNFNSKISTANWKTYTNTKYGFEFKYPPYIGDLIEKSENGEKWWQSTNKQISMTVSVGSISSEYAFVDGKTKGQLGDCRDSLGLHYCKWDFGDEDLEIHDVKIFNFDKNISVRIAYSPKTTVDAYLLDKIIHTFKFTN